MREREVHSACCAPDARRLQEPQLERGCRRCGSRVRVRVASGWSGRDDREPRVSDGDCVRRSQPHEVEPHDVLLYSTLLPTRCLIYQSYPQF